MSSTHLCHVFPVDLVWDRYFTESLKNYSREKSGVGVHTKVTCNCLLPTNRKTFLIFSRSKAELLPYLSNVVVNENTRQSDSVNSK